MKRLQSFITVVTIVAILVGPALLAYAGITRFDEIRFRAQGTISEASVTGKRRERGVTNTRAPQYLVRISFTTKPILEGGSLIVAEVPVSGMLYDRVIVNAEVPIRYLPNDPEQVMLEASLSGEGHPVAEQFWFGALLALVGVAGIIAQMILKRRLIAKIDSE